MLAEELQSKWDPILTHPDLAPIKDQHRRSVTAVVLENTEKALREANQYVPQTLTETAANATGADIDTFDPVLISLVRRAMPNLIAYDICGVQPMTGPTGLIFAMRSKYSNSSNSGVENFYNEVNSSFSSVVTGANTLGQKHVGGVPGNTTTGTANLAETGIYNFGSGMATANAEGNNAFAQMAFSIEKVTVTAKSRALKAETDLAIAQIKAQSGMMYGG